MAGGDVPPRAGEDRVISSPPKKSDLGVRALSAVVMIAVAGTALWLGGWVWIVFAALVAIGVLWEWNRLTAQISANSIKRSLWLVFGIVYVGLGSFELAALGGNTDGGEHWSRYFLIAILLVVIGTDIGAYFAGRTIGGPKIAPRISPSKTWAGLIGGMLCSSFLLLAWNAVTARGALLQIDSFPVAGLFSSWSEAIPWSFGCGAAGAVIAQVGDFFESWMKRRARVKDSSSLIPGHGGLFDRADGLIAVAFVVGLLQVVSSI
jgi:phosphatidate cytidylyltransferase